VVINKGVTVGTGGYSIVTQGYFINMGTIATGNPGDYANLETVGRNYNGSFGGSGGSGGGGNQALYGGNGFTPPSPKLNASVIQSMYNAGLNSYLTGATGGGACAAGGSGAPGGSTRMPGGSLPQPNGAVACTSSGGTFGASGSYGVFIEAYGISAGNITASGTQAALGEYDSGGGGGGGAILLVYGQGGYVAGRYNVKGGAGQRDSGAGGAGQVIAYSYGANPPINTP
jgi:hypothetical protein